ncbi:creatininase family protein [Fulvimarina endophytica]|uniref:Creatininase family protein n=1 Tax=Fulvimarina endophytica TaxID=2293836 RepID=A0A371X518_9HYPH|nr:creatininase family protein [Fulvimarina endophytica]RFC64322.1 creatininase family protein [Fulvimarina endophytica]
MQRFFENWTTRDLGEAAARLPRLVPILPVAAVEAHGPHLPLGTDAILARSMVAKVAALAEPDWPGLFLPVQSFGASAEHGRFPGTIDLGWRTFGDCVLAIGRSLKRAGFERMAIVNAHGGNSAMMSQTALDLRAEDGLFVATTSWLRFGYPDGLLPAGEIAEGIHGGAVETSLMLHLAPELVRREHIADFPSRQRDLVRTNRFLTAHGRHGFGWMSDDLNPAGVVGDARLASAKIGRAIADHQAKGFLAFVEEVSAFEAGGR